MYLDLVARFEAVQAAALQAAFIARALGRNVALPDPGARGRFDEALAAPPERVDPVKTAMLDAIGLGKGAGGGR